MRDLAQTILRLTGSASKLVFMPLPKDDPRQRLPDIELARTRLNWHPSTALDAGLSQTITYFAALLKEP